MTMVDWSVKGLAYGNCNCDYGCPCQFESLPTHGGCEGFEVIRIDQGRFADVNLDGLCVALFYAWPGPIFEGKGALQAIIDERADPAQRAALVKILHGEETEPGATHWWVFREMSSTVHEPLFLPIEFQMDLDGRTARVSIPGIVESAGGPIKSPVSGEEHRVRIDIPDGIEFRVAEIGSASTKATGEIKLDLKDSYGQFNHLYHTGKGVAD
jgi:hypothetical protein